MKQTAVEWLIEELTPSLELQDGYIDEFKEQAIEMEKQQIIDAFKDGQFDAIENEALGQTEKYYEEKFTNRLKINPK